MLKEIVEDAIGRREDMMIVGEAPTAEAALPELARLEPDVVVLGLAAGQTVDAGSEMLAARPRLRLFGVTADGRAVSLFELRPVVTPLGNLSPDQLVDAIRNAV